MAALMAARSVDTTAVRKELKSVGKTADKWAETRVDLMVAPMVGNWAATRVE